MFQGFPSGLLNEGPKDSLSGVKGSLIIVQGFVDLNIAKILITHAFYQTTNTSKYESID